MKTKQKLWNVGVFSLAVMAAVAGIGCGKKQAGSPVPVDEGHNHGAEAVGASYVEGKGIELIEETEKSIGLKLVEVGEESLWPEHVLNAQVYRAAGEASRKFGGERAGFAYATALIPKELAATLRLGQKIRCRSKENGDAILTGTVWKVDPAQVGIMGQAEALLELADPNQSLSVGTFVEAEAVLGSKASKVPGIPLSAVLTTATGSFAFVKNGDYLLRTEIKTGLKNQEFVEVTDGLYEGDTVAAEPVEALYLIELRATKGGGHCH